MAVDHTTLLLAIHVFVGLFLVGLGVQNYVAGRPLGLVLQGLMGVLVIAVGIGISRVIGSGSAE